LQETITTVIANRRFQTRLGLSQGSNPLLTRPFCYPPYPPPSPLLVPLLGIALLTCNLLKRPIHRISPCSCSLFLQECTVQLCN